MSARSSIEQNAAHAGEAPPQVVVAQSMGPLPAPLGLDAPLALLGGGDRLTPGGMASALGLDHVRGLRSFIAEACRSQALAGRDWYRQPPLALLGEHGVGKGLAAHWIARHAGLPLFRMPVTVDFAVDRSGAGGVEMRLPAVPLIAMAASRCANPIVVVELDVDHPPVGAALDELVRMLRLGAAVCGVGSIPRDQLRLMPVETKARAASEGTRMLEDWPLRLRTGIEDAIAAMQDVDGSARRELRASLLTATGTARGPGTAHALLGTALPEAFQEVGRAFAGLGGERLLASKAARRLGISHTELRSLAGAGAFQRETTLTGIYRRELYRADEIDAAAAAWKGSVPIAVVERAFGLPRYAAERLVACGDLAQETGAFVLSLPEQPRIRRESVDLYMETVCGAAGRLQRSTDVSVVAAMRAVGGRLKPWRQVFDAIVRGRLAASLGPGDGPLCRRLLIAVEEIWPFLDVEADEDVPTDFAFSATMSQMDAMSVLNLHQKDAPRIRSAGFLRFERVGRADIVPVDAVLAVAGAYMPLAEATARSRKSVRECRRELRAAFGDQPSLIGWPRPAAELLFPR